MSIITVLCPNPGPFTGPGTNTYLIVGGTDALVIDPGPVIPAHEAEILTALEGLTPVGVIATHTHPDHAPLSNPLAERLGVPVYGYGPGPRFTPDVALRDGDAVAAGSNQVTAVHTPGHTADHLCFLLGDTLFTGDHIMSGSTVIIEDAAAYLDSLYRVRELSVGRLEPGHGPPRDDAGVAIDEYIEHRLMRERQLIDAVDAGARTLGDLLGTVYAGIPAELEPAALAQVHVQLIKLADEGRVTLGEGGARSSTIVGPGEDGTGP